MSRVRSLLASTALTSTVALVVSVVPAGAAERKAETWATPGPSTITLTGHGYGHGHGLSQYGALGAAQQGLTWRQIVDFYYPGTTWATIGGRVRVLISGDTSPDLQVVSRPGLKVRSLESRRTWRLPAARATRWRLVGKHTRTTLVQRKVRGGWRTWKRFRGEGEFSGAGPTTLVLPGGKRASYRGKLRAVAPRSGRDRDTVNVLSMEAYLRGVVPNEVPALWHPEAVAAQSVAARTYAAAERAHPSSHDYDLCDTAHCQVYYGADTEHPASDAAIEATAKQGLFWDGRPAFTQFSASNGGWSRAGSMPFLVAQEDPYDAVANPKYHTWTHVVDDVTLERHWPALGDLTAIEVSSRDGNGEWGGRVETMSLVGTTGRADLTGDRLREVLGLNSSWFTFTVTQRLNRHPD